MEPKEMDRIFRKQKTAAAASDVLTVLFGLLYLTAVYSWLHMMNAGWEVLTGGLFLLYAGPMFISGGVCMLFLRKLWLPRSGVRGSGLKRAACFLAVFPAACLAQAAASVGALIGLLLTGRNNHKPETVSAREKERFDRSSLGYMVGSGQNAEWLVGGDIQGKGISLFGGLMVSLGCLMLCSGFAEGKGPGRAFDRSLEIYVRLKKWFDKLVVPGRNTALATPFLYGLFVIFSEGRAGASGEGRVSAAAGYFFFWLDRLEDVLPAAPFVFGILLFLIIMSAVRLQNRHFFRCFLLFGWNISWEEKYRERLQRDGIAPNIETVDFPGT